LDRSADQGVHTPLVQDWVGEQMRPQAPQFSASLRISTHSVLGATPQVVSELGH
jgi:hypothetical protein